MKYEIDNIHLPQQTKDQLSRLKRLTGIEQWNILCRWALCLSLQEKNNPQKLRPATDSNIDIAWRTFAGEHSTVYYSLLIDRCRQEDEDINKENLSWLLRRHIVRGTGYLIARRDLKNIDGLLKITSESK